MSHTFTTRRNRRYRYYTCTNAAKRGRQACPSGSLPAVEIEDAVVDQIRCIGRDPGLLGDTLDAARRQADEAIGRLEAERRAVERGRRRIQAEIRRASATTMDQEGAASVLANLNEQAAVAERRVTETNERVRELQVERIEAADVTAAFADFDNVWQSLSPREQSRLMQLLVKRVEFDAGDSTIEVTFHAAGIRSLAADVTMEAEEVA